MYAFGGKEDREKIHWAIFLLLPHPYHTQSQAQQSVRSATATELSKTSVGERKEGGKLCAGGGGGGGRGGGGGG